MRVEKTLAMYEGEEVAAEYEISGKMKTSKVEDVMCKRSKTEHEPLASREHAYHDVLLHWSCRRPHLNRKEGSIDARRQLSAVNFIHISNQKQLGQVDSSHT